MTRVFAVLLFGLIPLSASAQEERIDAVLDLAAEKFLKPIDRKELEERALRAFLTDLDPYSQYLNAQEWELYETSFTGSFGGVGATMRIDPEARLPRIGYLLIGSSAGEAGVRPGDLLAAIGGRSLEGMPLDEVIPLLRGTPGTTVDLTILRDGERIPLKVPRKAVKTPSVRGARRDVATGEPDFLLDAANGIGYIRILLFANDTVAAVERALDDLSRQKAKGIVLDLRDSMGGKLDAATDVADLLLDKGRIVSVVSRDGTESLDAKPGVATSVPVVMLINDRTASSAEILAGALADNGRVTTIGQRTFGKGRVQEKIALPAGMGGIVLSTGTFQRPSGKTIDKHDAKSAADAGIAPDEGMVMELEAAELESWRNDMDRLDGPYVLTADEQKLAMPDRVLRRAVEVLQRATSAPSPRTDAP